MPNPIRALVLILCAVTVAAPVAHSQSDPPGGPQIVWASLEITPSAPTRLKVMGQSPDPGIDAALQRIAGHPPKVSEYGGDWVQWTTELPAPTRREFLLRQTIPLEPLMELLQARGEPVLSLLIQHPRAAYVHLRGAPSLSVQRGTLSATVPTTRRVPLLLEVGWRRGDVARAMGFLMIALLLPILGGLIVLQRSLDQDQAPVAWFERAQMMQILSVSGWLLWMVVIEATQIADLIEFAFPGQSWARMTGPAWVMAFLPVALLLMSLMRRIARRLRGHDPLPREAGGLLGSLRRIAPLLLLVVAATTMIAGNHRVGVFSLLGAIGLAVLWPGARGPMGTKPQALSSGALRDRLFDLAQRAGVQLRELYVMPMRSQRLANAFAVHGGVVMVADELLDRMSRREVDAVLAHEITHLEHHHPIKALSASSVVMVVIIAVTATLRIPYGFPVAIALAWPTYLLFARRFEFAADAGAAALTSDPEATVACLGHLSRLNDTPLKWRRSWGWLVTHPTTEARGLAIGRRAGLAPERVAELLAKGLPEVERYGHRERPGEDERVFSTAWKTATQGRLGMGMLAASVATSAVALGMARAAGLPTPAAAVILGGAALGLGAVLLMQDQFAARVVSGLEPALRRRLKHPGASAGEELYVALSPGDRARIYEGFLDWDLGLLTVGTDQLVYRGEQITMMLPRRAVRAIEVGATAPGWIPAPRVIVRWLGPSGEEALTLRTADTKTVSAIGPASRALAKRLQTWHQSAVAPLAETHAAPPGIGPVTARTLAEATAPRDLPILLVLLGTFSAGFSFLLGFDFWLGLELLAAALIGIMTLRWPALTSREPSALKAKAAESERRAA